MSAETLKFFDDKSTENIINWMISNLTESQIRSCLNKDGSKDTTRIPQGSGSGINQGDAALNVQRIYRGRLARKAMKKSEPGPSAEYIGETIDNSRILEEIYSKCDGKGYIIAGVEDNIVTYYQFKELDSSIDIQAGIDRDVEDGVATWTYKKEPLDVFMSKSCESDDADIFQSLLEDEDNFKNYLPVSEDIYMAAQSYKYVGFEPPEVYTASGKVSTDPEIETPSYVMSETMMRAINSQKKSVDFMKKEFNDDSDYMKMWTVFFISVDEDNQLSYLYPYISSGEIQFAIGKMNPKILNMECKKITKKFVTEVRNQNISDVMNKLNTALKYHDDDTICRIEFNYNEQNHISLFGDVYFGDSDAGSEAASEAGSEAVSDAGSNFGSDEVAETIAEYYGENSPMIDQLTEFGDNCSTVGEDAIDTEFGGKKKSKTKKTSKNPFDMSAMYEGLDDNSDEDEFYSAGRAAAARAANVSVPRPMITSILKGITKQKKVSDMTIPEIEERMLRMHGAKYLSEFKPEKYKTKSGGTSVRYIRRTPKCVSTSECTCTPRVMDTSLSRYGDCPACIIAKFGNENGSETPVFSEFNTPDTAETNYGAEENVLLF